MGKIHESPLPLQNPAYATTFINPTLHLPAENQRKQTKNLSIQEAEAKKLTFTTTN